MSMLKQYMYLLKQIHEYQIYKDTNHELYNVYESRTV